MYDRTKKERRTSVVNWHNSKSKRRYRQIGRLLYHYCCVRYMNRIDGRWVETMEECPFCNGNGELLINDGNDVLFCSVCGGSGRISTLRRVKWIKEMGK